MNSNITILQQRRKALSPVFVNDKQRYTKANTLEKKFFNAMDYFFTMIILLSGEEEPDLVSINHIL